MFCNVHNGAKPRANSCMYVIPKLQSKHLMTKGLSAQSTYITQNTPLLVTCICIVAQII